MRPEGVHGDNQSYVIANEIRQKGAEILMAEETPLDRQWTLLEQLRDEWDEMG